MYMNIIENANDLTVGILNAEKTRAEFETASKLTHPKILKVLHVFRYREIRYDSG